MFDFKINNPDRTILIETATNGYVITKFSQYSDTDEFHSVSTVVEINDQDEYQEDFDAVAKLLWGILENMEIWNSKHFTKRIEINVESNK
jgi:hypothetical protein